MAKWGEGDPRWIVEERPDATNVNNWHWTEKNATPWSKDRLKELLEGLTISSGSGDNLLEARITKLTKVEGEATANNRKAKLIFLFEWELKADWEGTDGEGDEAKGELVIPNLSDENEADEVDVEVTAEGNSDAAHKLKQLWLKRGRDEIRKRLATYIASLKEEFSTGMVLPTSKAAANGTEKPKVDVAKAAAAKREVVGAVENLSVSGGAKISTTKLSMKEEFKAPAAEVFAAFTSQDMLAAFSNAPAVSEAHKGGRFALYNGMVEGAYEAVEAPKSLSLRWRLKSYPPGHHAQIQLSFEETGDATKLRLSATQVPAEEAERTEDGWRRHYFQNIKRTFGFGAMLI